MADYRFVSVWNLEAPLEAVWQAIYQAEQWPQWWRGVESVVQVKPGDANGVGSLYSCVWKSELPYRLKFNMGRTSVEPMSLITGPAQGDLDGTGELRFSSDGRITTLRIQWNVSTTEWWMNLLAPLVRPLFAWNHRVIMGWGANGLAARLNARLLDHQEQ